MTRLPARGPLCVLALACALVLMSSCGTREKGLSAPVEHHDTTENPQGGTRAVRKPRATILPALGSYDEREGLFYLPISLGAGEFVREPRAEDFRLGDERLSVAGVDHDGSVPDEATLKIAAKGAGSAREAFDVLDEALTASGVEVAASATNCGTVHVGSDDMRAAKRAGYETTALSCLAARPKAVVDATHATEGERRGGESVYDVRLQAKVDARPGSCALPDDAGQQLSLARLDGGDAGEMLGKDVQLLDGTKLYLSVPLPESVAEALTGAQGKDALAKAQPLVAEFARAHKLVLAPGVLSNAWGIAEPAREVPIYITRDLARDEAAERQSYAEKHEMMERTGELPADDDASDRAGLAYLLGGEGASQLDSAEDMVAWLAESGERAGAIDAQLDQLWSQLAAIERRLGYDAGLDELRAAVARTRIYASVPKMDARAVATIQDAYGLSAVKDCLKLGALVPDAIEQYDACIAAALDWEPARTACHRLFVRHLEYAYLSGYAAATTQAQGEEAAALRESRQQLRRYFDD